MKPTVALALRPLSIGEIFDRAVTLYVRNFALFTLMILTVTIPLAIVQYSVAGSQAATLQAAISAIEHPPSAAKGAGATKPVNPFGDLSAGQLGGYVLLIVVALVAAPFASNAVAVGVAALYADGAPSYKRSFAAVLKRWPQMLGVLGVWVGIGICAYIGVVLIAMVLLLMGIALGGFAPVLGVLVAIFGGLLFIALLGLAIVAVLAASFSFFAVSIERQPVFRAIGSAFARIFGRAELRRAILIGLAYMGIELGAMTMAGAVGLAVIFFLKNIALQVAISAIVNALLSSFLTVLLAVYYYDVRIRREGFDVEADLQRLSA